MTWIVAAVTAALVFGILDAAWLGWAGPNFYRPQLGGLLAESFRMVPALLFYCAYICAIVWFAVSFSVVRWLCLSWWFGYMGTTPHQTQSVIHYSNM